MAEKVTTEDRGAVRILRINRPEQRNCVDGETAVGLGRAIEAFAADASARVLVVTGAGDLAFCAGADLKNARDPLRPRVRGHGRADGLRAARSRQADDRRGQRLLLRRRRRARGLVRHPHRRRQRRVRLPLAALGRAVHRRRYAALPAHPRHRATRSTC